MPITVTLCVHKEKYSVWHSNHQISYRKHPDFHPVSGDSFSLTFANRKQNPKGNYVICNYHCVIEGKRVNDLPMHGFLLTGY